MAVDMDIEMDRDGNWDSYSDIYICIDRHRQRPGRDGMGWAGLGWDGTGQENSWAGTGIQETKK